MTLTAPTAWIIPPTDPTTADGPRMQTENKMCVIIISANKKGTCLVMRRDKTPAVTSELQFQVIYRLTWYVLVRAFQCIYVKKKYWKKWYFPENCDMINGSIHLRWASMEQYFTCHARGQHSATDELSVVCVFAPSSQVLKQWWQQAEMFRRC